MIIPVDRPFSRRLTSCVPSVLNDTLNEIVDQGRLGELRRAIKCDKNKLIPKGTMVVKLESTQIDSSKKQEGFFLFLED